MRAICIPADADGELKNGVLHQTESQRDALEELAGEFAELHRCGQGPTVEEFAAQHSHFAEDIRDLFPMILAIEQRARSSQRMEEHASQDLAARTRLGDFEILREIGRGGMGVVYEAEQVSLRRRVAVKVLSRHLLHCERDIARFQREAQTAANLHHTNIVPIFAVGQQQDVHYIAMQLIRGVGLDEVFCELRRLVLTNRNADFESASSTSKQDIASRSARSLLTREMRRSALPDLRGTASRTSGVSTNGGAFEPTSTKTPREPSGHGSHAEASVRERFSAKGEEFGSLPAEYFRNVARIGQQVAGALHYAHMHGTLHRDIKPANLLLDNEGLVWIADFGLAKRQEHGNLSHDNVVGTLRYMAPERFHASADPQSDIYSLGITLYELLTLDHAFKTHDRPSIVRQITRGELPSPRKKNRDIPHDLEQIVVRATACEPAERYQSAADLVEDLQCFLDDLPLKTRPVPAHERLWRWCRRNPATAMLAGSALSLLLVATILAGFLAVLSRTSYVREVRLRERAESTTRVAIDVLDQIYAEFAPNRVVSASLATTDEGTGEGPLPAAPPIVSKETAELLESLLAFYDRIAEEGDDDERAEVLLKSAIAQRRIGDIHRQVGHFEEAQAAFERALDVYRRLGALSRQDATLQTQIAAIHNNLGIVFTERRRFREADRSHRQALWALEPVVTNPAPSHAARYELARTYYFLGNKPPWFMHRVHRPIGRKLQPDQPEGCPITPEGFLQASVQVLQSLIEENPANPEYRHLMARCYLASSMFHRHDGKREEQAIQILTELAQEFPRVADYRYELGEVYSRVDLRHLDEHAAAEDPEICGIEDRLRRAIEVTRQLVLQYPTVPRYYRFRVRVHSSLAGLLARTGRLKEAEKYYERTVLIQQSLKDLLPDEQIHKAWLALFQIELAEVLHRQDEGVQARMLLNEALTTLESMLAELPQHEDASRHHAQRFASRGYESLSRLLTDMQLHDEAAEAEENAERYGSHATAFGRHRS